MLPPNDVSSILIVGTTFTIPAGGGTGSLDVVDGLVGVGQAEGVQVFVIEPGPTGKGFAVEAKEVALKLPKLTFLRGDCNDDGKVDLADAVCTLNWLFGGAATPGCLAALNTNGDAAVNITDPVSLLDFLFGGGSKPVDPFPDCGPGILPADAELGCVNPRNC